MYEQAALKRIPDLDFQLIFITSYNQYALKAIRYSALDYILKPIDIDELIEADGRYSKISILNQSELLASINLKEFEELLDNSSFFRIHHRYLINMNLMKSYVRADGGLVTMANDCSVPVSRRKK